jgi:hypothetical protein
MLQPKKNTPGYPPAEISRLAISLAKVVLLGSLGGSPQ